MPSIDTPNVKSSKRRIKSNTLNSKSKLQYILGCDDVEELKSNLNTTTSKTPTKTSQKLKNIFDIKFIKIGSIKNKKKQQNTKSKYPKKCIKSRYSSKSEPIMPNNNDKILWKPSLQIIYKDALLLNALVTFMQKSYNSENISFLLSINELKESKQLKHLITDSQIISIYNEYINPNSEHQINVSYNCFMDILFKRDKFSVFNIEQKYSMFDVCVKEIEHLMVTSILPSFYWSLNFQCVANESTYYRNYLLNNVSNTNKKHNVQEQHANNKDIDGFIEPILVRNKRPSITCELYNSITEISKDTSIDKDIQ